MLKCRDSNRGPGRPRQLDTVEREAMILAAAERVILSKGLGGASMATIAKEAGMSKRTLYEVFDSRAALFASIIRRIRNMMTRQLSARELELPLGERLRLLLTPSTENFSNFLPITILRAVVTEAERQPDIAREFLQEGPHAVYKMVQLELDRSVSRGEIHISDTESASRLMADMAHEGVLEHLVAAAPVEERKIAFNHRLDLAIRVFLGGIGELE